MKCAELPSGLLLVGVLFGSCVGRTSSQQVSRLIVPNEEIVLEFSGRAVNLDDSKGICIISDWELGWLERHLDWMLKMDPTNSLIGTTRRAIVSGFPLPGARPLPKSELKSAGRVLGTIRGVPRSAEFCSTRKGPHIGLVHVGFNLRGRHFVAYLLRSDATPELAEWRLLLMQSVEY